MLVVLCQKHAIMRESMQQTHVHAIGSPRDLEIKKEHEMNIAREMMK